MTDIETTTVRIESEDGATDELTLPQELIDMVDEGGQTEAEVVADVAMLSFASRVHHLVAHSEGEPDEEMQAIEGETMDRFEERFGMTFGEATGHDH
ncbi:MAG: hypothetical protein ACI91T_001259 [Natronomonas sp.]|jgi:hypothetical protein